MNTLPKDIRVSIIGKDEQHRDGFAELSSFLSDTYTLLAMDDHLESIRDSDFVILFTPGNNVSVNEAFELGYASALGIPVVTKHQPVGVTLTSLITNSDIKSLDLNAINPGAGLKYLQNYYARTADRRGWGKETARDTMLLITEEMGELARAVRKFEGIARTSEYDVNMADELADVQLYLVHLANNVGIDISDAVTAKDRKNGEKLAAKV